VRCSQLQNVDQQRRARLALHAPYIFGYTHTCSSIPGLHAGNLEDITLRAVRVLRAADLVLAEDTRRTRQLLTHLNIRGAALTSFHEHNERGKQEQVPASKVLHLPYHCRVAFVGPGLNEPAC